jgi:hypothetical protein
MDQGMISALLAAVLVRVVGVLTSWESLLRARTEYAALQLGGWVLYSAAQVVGLLALGSGAYTSPGFLALSVAAVYLLAAAGVGHFRPLPHRWFTLGGTALLSAVVFFLAEFAPRAGLRLTLLSQSLVLISVVVYAFRRRSRLRVETPVAYRWSIALVAASVAHVAGHLTFYSSFPAFTPVAMEAALAVVGIVFFVQLDSDMARFQALQAGAELEARGLLLQRSQEIAHFGS